VLDDRGLGSHLTIEFLKGEGYFLSAAPMPSRRLMISPRSPRAWSAATRSLWLRQDPILAGTRRQRALYARELGVWLLIIGHGRPAGGSPRSADGMISRAGERERGNKLPDHAGNDALR